MCGAKLAMPVRDALAPRTDPAVPEPPAVQARTPSRPVSGLSFLGLADEPSDPVSYLLEDEPSSSRRGLYLVLALFIVGAAATGWYWRQDLRSLASRLSGGSPAQSQEAPNQSPSPTTASSEAQTPASAAPEVTPPPAAGASNQGAPASAPATTASPAAQSAASAAAPTGTPSTPSAAQLASPSPVAGSQPDQTAPAASGDDSQPANSDSKNKDEASAKNVEVATSETQAVKPAAKSAKTSADQLPEGSESDALEAQGEKYLYGNGVPANCALAQKSLQAAAERSNAKAQSVLGTMYATGHCANRDLPLAYRWFARALRQDPSNLRIEQDLKVLWSQMSPDERQLALRAAR